MQGCLTLEKSIHEIFYLNRIKGKNCMIISINADNYLIKFSNLMMYRKLEIERDFSNLKLKMLLQKSIAYIVPNGEILKTFFLRSVIRKRCLQQF